MAFEIAWIATLLQSEDTKHEHKNSDLGLHLCKLKIKLR